MGDRSISYRATEHEAMSNTDEPALLKLLHPELDAKRWVYESLGYLDAVYKQLKNLAVDQPLTHVLGTLMGRSRSMPR